MNKTVTTTESALGTWWSTDPVLQAMDAIVNDFFGSEIFK